MNKVRITAVRQTVYEDLMAQYENPIEHTCDVTAGQQWISINGQCPEGMCPSAWESMRPFVESLARGEGNFFDGWMKNIDIFDFSLSDDDMAQIAKMNQHDAGTINFGDPQFVKYLIQNYG